MADILKNVSSVKNNRGTTLTSETLFKNLYKGPENQMTRALLQVIEAGGIDFLWYLINNLTECNGLPKNYLDVKTQIKERHNKSDVGEPTCDGVIETVPLKLFIEAKMPGNKVNLEQLQKYKAAVEEAREREIVSFILYITADNEHPEILKDEEVCIWQSWDEIMKIIEKYPSITPHITYLIKGLKGLWNQLTHKSQSIPQDKLVAVVAGKVGYPRALEKKIYNCQPGRDFRNAPYLAFYADRAISKVFKMSKISPEDKDKYEKIKDLPPTDDFYELEPLDNIIKQPIVNTDRDKRGNLKPFTMGVTRYVNLDTLPCAKDIAELKRLNSLKE